MHRPASIFMRPLLNGLFLVTFCLSFPITVLAAPEKTPTDPGKTATEKVATKPQKKSEAVSKKPPKEATAAANALADLDTSKLSPETQAELKRLGNALHEQNQAIYNELKDDEELSVKDIAMLWQAAVERSGTIRYAIEKLSRRDATGKPVANDSFTKRMLQSIARVGGVAGSVWSGNPAGILGGNMVEEMMRGNPQDPAMAKVTDADMLILAKEVESLQSQVIESYYEYRHAQERWKISQQATESLQKFHEKFNDPDTPAQKPEHLALQPLVESLFQSARQEESSAKQGFVHARNALGLLVGADALVALEQASQQNAQLP